MTELERLFFLLESGSYKAEEGLVLFKRVKEILYTNPFVKITSKSDFLYGFVRRDFNYVKETNILKPTSFGYFLQGYLADNLLQKKEYFFKSIMMQPKKSLAYIFLYQIDDQRWLNIALKNVPNCPILLFEYAKLQYSRNNINTARSVMKRVIDLYPTREHLSFYADLYIDPRNLEQVKCIYSYLFSNYGAI